MNYTLTPSLFRWEHYQHLRFLMLSCKLINYVLNDYMLFNLFVFLIYDSQKACQNWAGVWVQGAWPICGSVWPGISLKINGVFFLYMFVIYFYAVRRLFLWQSTNTVSFKNALSESHCLKLNQFFGNCQRSVISLGVSLHNMPNGKYVNIFTHGYRRCKRKRRRNTLVAVLQCSLPSTFLCRHFFWEITNSDQCLYKFKSNSSM